MSVIVKHPGFYSSIQDRGRRGLRHLGIPWAGVGCEPWMRFANRLLNQDLATPVIETMEAGLTLIANSKPVRFAMVGDVKASIVRANGTTHKAIGWRSYTLHTGDTLKITATGNMRCAVVAIAGLTIEPHFGSTSTYANARLGGLSGNALAVNDELPISDHPIDEPHLALPVFTFPGQSEPSPENPFMVRAVPGPQDDYFSTVTLNQFFDSTYTLSQDIDRMGARLTGPMLNHKSAELRDLVSDAILPGSVQVPGSGLPIVMLSDAHTVGGYPKIATVVSADLSLFSLYRPGQTLQFVNVDSNEGLAHTRRVEQLIQTHLTHVQAITAEDLNSERLLGLNLVSGVTDALY